MIENRNANIKKVLLWLLAILSLALLVMAAYLFQARFFRSHTNGSELSKDVKAVVTSARSGEYEKATQQYNAALSTPLTATQKAQATLNNHAVTFKITGDIKDRLQDINDQKAIVTDTSIDLNTRIYALNNLASAFCGSGRNPLVFEEIFKGSPFSDHLALNDPNLSSRQLHEWSFQLMPTAKAATRIARWYAEDMLWHKDLATATKQYDIEQAEKYLNVGAQLYNKEQTTGAYGHSTESKQSASYLYWRAMVIGGLGVSVGAPYKDQYRKEFEDFFAFIQTHGTASTKTYLPYAHMFYAKFLILNDNDTTEAKRQLQMTIDYVKSDPHPETQEFATFVQNERQLKPWDFSSQAMRDMEDLYLPFKEFVTNLDTSASTTAVYQGEVGFAELAD